MDTCKTCKHFKDESGPEHPNLPTGYGSCSRWHVGYGVPIAEVSPNEVLVENDEGWGMLMGPDFGCVLHEPTPPVQA